MWRALRIALVLVLAVAAFVFFVFGILPGWIEPVANRVVDHDPYVIRPEIAQRHRELVVVDWHADSLLWGRDLLARGAVGHVDVPRLVEGNVAIQVFDAVTKTPLGLNYETNRGDSLDMITLLAVVQGWPTATWTNLTERAVLQASRLHRFAARAPDRLRVVTTRAELDDVLARRAAGERGLVGAVLGIEGLHALERDLANVDRLFESGYRVMGLQHFFDNALGGSLHGESGAGLSDFGRRVVARMQELGIVIDVAHSSPAVVDDVLAVSRRPVVVSHTGIHGVCPSPRNLQDDQMRRIAQRGGVIAVGYWDAVCDTTPEGVVKALRRAIEIAGEDHVSLGSDYDGGTNVRFDTSELAALTQAMVDAGFTGSEIEKVMGGNAIRILREQLPLR